MTVKTARTLLPRTTCSKEPTPTKACVQEINKSRKESRSIVTAPVSAE